MLKRCAVVLILLVFSSVALAEAEDFKALRITTHELAYANLYRPISIPGGANVIVLEYSVKGEKINGYASGGAVHLWWNSGKYIANKLDSVGSKSAPGMLRLMTPSRVFVNKETYPMEEGVWYRKKIEMTPSEIVFYIKRLDDAEWTELYRTSRDLSLFLPPDGIIIGVGRHDGPAPYLRNTYSELRNVGSVYFADVILTVDGKVLLHETFEKTIDELKKIWDFATDPANKEPVFEILPHDAAILEGEG